MEIATSLDIWRDVLREQQEEENLLMFRNKWVPLFYNWITFVLLIALLISTFVYGVQVKIEKQVTSKTAIALADYRAELDAQDAAEAAYQQAILNRDAEAMAKAFYGIRLFVEKYHYTESDLETYARCMFNRVENDDLAKVVRLTGQFAGYSDDNPVLEEYYTLALRFVEDWTVESAKPCDPAYVFAELTPDGIFLKKDLHAGPYERRWHA